ncbi:MAG: RNA polymerase sigma factor, partial [Bacteroidales bacterium]
MQVDLYSDAEIVKGCQQNDRKYQEILYRRFARMMYGICLSYANNRAQAQDILHEAFLKIFKGISGYKGEGSLEGWIRRIVTHTAIDQLRKDARLGNYLTDTAEAPEVAIPETALGQMQAKEILKQVSRLPAGARAIFNLYALEGYTHREIALELDISEGTSRSQYSRARNLLMDWVGKKGQ